MKSFVLRTLALAATVVSVGAFAQGSTGSQPQQQDQMDQQQQQQSPYDTPSTATPTDTTKSAAVGKKAINLEKAKYLIILPAGADQQQVLSDLVSNKGVDKFAWSCEAQTGSSGAMGGSASDTTQMGSTGSDTTPTRSTGKSLGGEEQVTATDCTGYMFVNADSETAALQNVPDTIRSKAKVEKLHQFSRQEQKQLQSKTSSR